MASSPIYGWAEPDNTDLVKNGALAIRTLGNAIDTTMATMTAKSSYVAKGSILAATAASTPSNLTVGNNGESLVADSSTSTGLRYQPSTGRNFALNTDFTIFQRGTSVTPTASGGAYTADRWYVTRGSNTSVTVSQQTAGNLSVTPNQAFRYFGRVQRTAASTTTSDVAFGQMFETSQVTLLAGQTVTLSGFIRKGANFSATSDALVMSIIEGTGTDQKQMDGGYTGQNTLVSGTKTLTTSWQRFSVTGTIATTSTEITIKFSYTPTGTAGAADYFDIVGVQLELGSVATSWNLAMNTLQGELAACQRYYWRSTQNSSSGQIYANGFAISTTAVSASFCLPVQMRVVPTSIGYANITVTDEVTPLTPSAMVANSRTGVNILQLQATVTGSVLYRSYFIIASGLNSYVEAIAEL